MRNNSKQSFSYVALMLGLRYYLQSDKWKRFHCFAIWPF